ncbi:SDR family NAD(P)-dependent oxidoreductase [Natrinema halophilum]|uniref:SDR family NAD(P)-dependent oxidoreductase n=1 Tax=Natrinema halophilum TaxID=1699371 RepID=A0A7D5GJZ7_9EURY|nr:SDR family NAD(P)-dependent oxidoreductase [Natrinema halophilum]QLG48212.1 SDR family NAD(P)-dependent oxidoreductase [Natrinema halophilum]
MSQERGAIIVGASSGIGAALSRRLADDGYEIGLVARRTERMRQIGSELPTKSYVATIDVTDTEDAREGFFELADAMSSVDVVVISSGVAHVNRDLEWELERETIDVNVRGFTAIATAAIQYFEQHPDHASKTDGHLVGISSVAAHFGMGNVQAYNASKAYISTYLEGLRSRQIDRDADVTITTIEPGYVDSDLSLGRLWECSPETAADQIARAIHKKRTHAYVVRRWRLVAWFLDLVPDGLLRRLF